ncbi:tetratricopeptide (TPR) repeat protein [Bradyrhizobium japonicum]
MANTPFDLDRDLTEPQSPGTPANTHSSTINFGGDKEFKITAVKKGGMGTILIGCFVATPSAKLAVKAFDERWFFDSQVRQAFQREISVWLQLSDTPFVFPAIEVQNVKGVPHVLMPLVEPDENGVVSVGDLVRMSAGGVDSERIFEIALATALGLEAANRRIPGVIHGDIKPDNILLPGGTAQVSDFGLAQVLNAGRSADAPAGTPEYLAPEIWNGRPREIAGDIYAYGCMLYELLTGSPPYGRDRSKQRDAHCTAAVPAKLFTDNTTVPALLTALSIWCLAKDPRDRPTSFKIIVGELLKIGMQHAPERTARFVSYVVNFDEIGKDIAAEMGRGDDAMTSLLEHRIGSLIEAGELEAALDAIDRIPIEKRSANMLVMTGSALSLSGDDEQALDYFERALALNPDPETTVRCMSEKGLSLRRLKRYEEAISLYDGLVETSPNEQLVTIVANYAGTLLDAGRLQEAEARAQGLVKHAPDEARAWTLLGQIQAALERYDKAIESYTRACRLDPGMVQARFERGVLLLDHFLDLEGALADFDFTFGQAYHTKDLIVRLIASNLVLKRPEALQLMRGLEKQDSELAIKITREAMDLARQILEKLDRRAFAASKRAESEKTRKPWDGLRTAWRAVKGRLGKQTAETSSEQAVERAKCARMEGALLLEGEGFDAKMLAHRIYVDEAWIALDYYNDMRDPEYPAIFGNGVRSLFRALMHQVPGLAVTSVPFNFVRCTNCGHVLLSNRSPNELLLCRRCDRKGAVKIAEGISDAGLIEACEQSAGLVRRSLEGRSVVLIIWLLKSLDPVVAEERAKQLGWKRQSNETVVRWFADEASSRGFGKLPKEALMFTHRCSASDFIYEDGATPWSVQQLMISLTEKFGRQSSASMLASDEMMRVIFESPKERINSIQAEYGALPSDPEVRGLLIKLLAHEGRLDEASALVPPASQWTTSAEPHLLEGRGVLAHRRGRLAEARDLLERARDLAPLDFSVRASLLEVYREQNEVELARAEFNKIRSIGLVYPR